MMNSSKIKSIATVLIILLSLTAAEVHSQTKKEIQFSLDTLYRSNLKLQEEYRKLIEVWKQYDTFYTHVKLSMLDKEFANESIVKGVPLFDEVWKEKTARLDLLEDSTVFLLDSLNHLYEEQVGLLAQNELYLRMLTGQLNEAAYPNTEQELIGLWQLYLSPMQLSGEAYRTGLVSYNPFTVADSLQKHNVYQMEFKAEELAIIYFKDGRKQNCFYEVVNFNVGKPYEINCSKQQDEFEMTIHISPMPSGLEVSYEIPLDTTQVVYFNGVMKH
ncbi:hypothetical protein [Carboxylicivirga marina]|uniref:hypothetical protein n=1 Tax=Carboxylicivirga marina TaxID=2800988 RepID=UPI0025994A24|nr:hypothetical protein [uncultured Carboxylicivirga sp.]